MKRYLYGESVKGASHKRSGMPLQDSCLIQEISDNIAILAVADGHGSEKCPRSKSGSQIAVNTFIEVMKKYLLGYGQHEEGLTSLATFLNREGDMRFAQDICEEWQKRIRASFNKNKDDSCLNDDKTVDWEKAYKLYGTTLLGMLITKGYVFCFQIGDGDITLIDNEGVSTVVETEKMLGVETHSLSKIDAWKHSSTMLRRRDMDENTPYLYMLTTDGFANSYPSDEGFADACKGYFDSIKTNGFDPVRAAMPKWLEETSELGCGDDITAVLAYFSE